MFKNMVAIKNRMTQVTNMRQSNMFFKTLPKRTFSYNQMPSGGRSYGMGTMLGIGVGTAGLMYLSYYSRTLNHQRMMNSPRN